MNSLERTLILKTGQETGWENVLEDHEQRICLVSSRHPAQPRVLNVVMAMVGQGL